MDSASAIETLLKISKTRDGGGFFLVGLVCID